MILARSVLLGLVLISLECDHQKLSNYSCFDLPINQRYHLPHEDFDLFQFICQRPQVNSLDTNVMISRKFLSTILGGTNWKPLPQFRNWTVECWS